MAPCKVHGGCKHPDMVGGHRCCTNCKELIHNLCIQKANGAQNDAPELESGFTCSPAGACLGAVAHPPPTRDIGGATFDSASGTCAKGATCTRGRKDEALNGVKDCCGSGGHLLCVQLLPCANCSSSTGDNTVAAAAAALEEGKSDDVGLLLTPLAGV